MLETLRSALPRLTARVVAVLLLALGGGLALGTTTAGPAGATTTAPGDCTPQFVRVSTKNARAVFSGVVTTSTAQPRATGQRTTLYVQDVTVDRVYKGDIRSETVQVRTDTTPRACSLGPLVPGQAYMFFTQADNDLWVASGDGGTATSTEQLVNQVVRLLGSGRTPTPPEQEEAVFTPADTAEPTSVTRAAAPGLALVLIGLLGLFVVRRVGRR